MERLNSQDLAGVDEGEVHQRTTGYRLLYAENGLAFREVVVSDPVPSGRQVLEAAGVRDPEAFTLVALLATGAMEDIRLGETYDLRARGTERVIAFRTDVLYRAFLRGQDLMWGRQDIRGEELYQLAALSEDEALYRDVPGGTDIFITPETSIDLATPGVERFIVGPKPVPGFEIAISYNGIVRRVRVKPQDRIAAVIEAVRPIFGNPGGDLVLVDTATGQVLDPGQTIGRAGVRPGSHLQLRPGAVRGG